MTSFEQVNNDIEKFGLRAEDAQDQDCTEECDLEKTPNSRKTDAT
jgi:hypothetical protein